MPDQPLHGRNFGVAGTITPLVDLWVEERRLPGYMRAAPSYFGKFMKSQAADRA